MPSKLPLVLALALVVATAGMARAQDDDDTPSLDDTPRITVGGTASTEVPPDLATITLGVTSHKPTAKAAADATATAAQAVIDEAKAEGVKPVDITTQTLSLAQTFENQQDAHGNFIGRKPTGFDASNNVAIRIRDLAKAGALAQALIDKGANDFEGIAFSVEHPQPILDKLAGEAVANAKRQAVIMAQAAGVKLGRVLAIERSTASSPRIFRFSGGTTFGSERRVAAPAPMPVEAGSQGLAADATVTWAIDQP